MESSKLILFLEVSSTPSDIYDLKRGNPAVFLSPDMSNKELCIVILRLLSIRNYLIRIISNGCKLINHFILFRDDNCYKTSMYVYRLAHEAGSILLLIQTYSWRQMEHYSNPQDAHIDYPKDFKIHICIFTFH